MTYEGNYQKLEKLGLDFSSLPEYAKSTVPGLMDLNFDFLQAENDCVIFALSHYYKQNGDMIADPDMVIRVNTVHKTAAALSYQDAFGYREVYSNGKLDVKAKIELNKFLNQWLSNLINQGHSLAVSLEVAA